MNSRLGSYLKGKLRRIVVTRRGDSPRIVWARLYGTRGISTIRGDSLPVRARRLRPLDELPQGGPLGAERRGT